jgi:hypothetical protein
MSVVGDYTLPVRTVVDRSMQINVFDGLGIAMRIDNCSTGGMDSIPGDRDSQSIAL